jgi:hypothetical protein
LYLRPLLQGHGWFLPIFMMTILLHDAASRAIVLWLTAYILADPDDVSPEGRLDTQMLGC